MYKNCFSFKIVVAILACVVVLSSCDDKGDSPAEAGRKYAQEICVCFQKPTETESEDCADIVFNKYAHYGENEDFEDSFWSEIANCEAEFPHWWTGGSGVDYIFDSYYAMHERYAEVVRLSYLIDASLTQEYAHYHELANFSFTAADQAVRSLWDASFNAILNFNYVLANIEHLYDIGLGAYAYEMHAEARYYRAYVNYVLLNYFGSIPRITSVEMPQITQQATRQVIESAILDDCQMASGLSEGNQYINPFELSQMRLRVLINRGAFNEAYMHFMNIYVNGMNLYGWNISVPISPVLHISLPQQMDKHGNVAYPMRFAETLLIGIEVALGRQSINDAAMILEEFDIYNMYDASLDEIRAELPALWNEHLAREGHTFARLKRAGAQTFLNALGQYGATEKHMLLPIPQAIMDANPNWTQNAGW